MQGYSARKVICSCVNSEHISLWAEFVNKKRCISVRLISEEIKSIKILIILIIHIIVSYDQNISKMDPMSGSDNRLVFTLPPRNSTLQYKRCVHLWNNFPCIITLNMKYHEIPVKTSKSNYFITFFFQFYQKNIFHRVVHKTSQKAVLMSK